MKKIAIGALGLIGLGFVLMLIGFAAGVTPLYVDSTGMHRRTLQPEAEKFLTDYDKTTNVTLALTSEDVTIVQDADRFGYSVTGTFYQTFDYSLTSDSLSIKEKSPRYFVNFGWSGIGWNDLVLFGSGVNFGPKITVYIPKDMTIETLDLSLMSGDVRIDSLKTRNVRINGASGNITAKNLLVEDALTANLMSGDILFDSVEAQTMRIDGASGNFTARGIAIERMLAINLMSGDVSISGDLRGETSFSGASGNLSLEIDGKASDYEWRIDAFAADITVRDSSNTLPNSSSGGPNRISVDAMSGDISIRFLK